MQHTLVFHRYLMLLLFAVLATACGGKDKVVPQVPEQPQVIIKKKLDEPAEVVIRIRTTGDLNPDINGRPSPIILRIYSLTSDDAFNNARFFELYESGEDTLGDDMLWQQELEVSPREAIELENMTLNPKARYLGFMAAYRDLDRAVWRGRIATPLNTKTFIHVTLDELSISVEEGSKRSDFVPD